jgi:hypothetical protein
LFYYWAYTHEGKPKKRKKKTREDEYQDDWVEWYDLQRHKRDVAPLVGKKIALWTKDEIKIFCGLCRKAKADFAKQRKARDIQLRAELKRLREENAMLRGEPCMKRVKIILQ